MTHQSKYMLKIIYFSIWTFFIIWIKISVELQCKANGNCKLENIFRRQLQTRTLSHKCRGKKKLAADLSYLDQVNSERYNTNLSPFTSTNLRVIFIIAALSRSWKWAVSKQQFLAITMLSISYKGLEQDKKMTIPDETK